MRNGVVADGEKGGKVVVVGEEVGADLGLDVERVGLKPLDEEAEIRCGERAGRVREVAGREEIPDVDRVEERVHDVASPRYHGFEGMPGGFEC